VSTDDLTIRRLGDFAHVDAGDAVDMVGRLDAMHALDAFQAYKRETFDQLRPAPGKRLADLGCGTGGDAGKLIGRVQPGGSVTGFDISEAMLTQARERHGQVDGLDFVKIDASGLDAPDDSFDGIRADRVLIHVPDPRATLAEMIRVTKPGGRIVISEPDMPGCWVASDNYPLTDRIMAEIAKSCISPYFARDLYPTFKSTPGLKDISFSIWSLTAFDPASVSKILDLSGVVESMYSRGLISPGEVEEVLTDFTARGRDGRFVASAPVMVAAATKA